MLRAAPFHLILMTIFQDNVWHNKQWCLNETTDLNTSHLQSKFSRSPEDVSSCQWQKNILLVLRTTLVLFTQACFAEHVRLTHLRAWNSSSLVFTLPHNRLCFILRKSRSKPKAAWSSQLWASEQRMTFFGDAWNSFRCTWDQISAQRLDNLTRNFCGFLQSVQSTAYLASLIPT
jgi:hypothetical protein